MNNERRMEAHVYAKCSQYLGNTVGKYLIYGDIISWKSMAAVVVCIQFLENKYLVGNLIGTVLSFLS